MRRPHYSTLLSSFTIAVALICFQGCDSGRGNDGTPLDTHLKVELKHSSSLPTLEEISPYEEALVINEYQVLEVLGGDKIDSENIRIAQWAITNKQSMPAPGSQEQELWITPLASMPGLKSVYQRNDLDFDPDEKIYYDLSPIPDTYAPPKNVRSDYRSDISRRLRVYWLIRRQLKLAVIGNSHSAAGVDTEMFYQPGNAKTPVTLNFSPAGSGIEFQSLLADEYLTGLPEFEWLVWGVSPRIFNQYYAIDRRAKLFKKSPGYIYDKQHWKKLTSAPAPPQPLSYKEIRKQLNSKDKPWGWAKKESRSFSVPINPDARDEILIRCRRPHFKWNLDAWTQFQQSVENISRQGVKVLLFIPPYHPLITPTRVADGDGTGNDDYKKLVKKLKSLSENNPSVYFLDIHKGGKHEFEHRHFSDIDHLHVSGAQILTSKLVDFVEKVDQQSK